jgi:hypothetical protein
MRAPMSRGLKPGLARPDKSGDRNPFIKDPNKRNRAGRPKGSVNKYPSVFKKLFLETMEEVGDSQEVGKDGSGGALAYLEVSAIKERKTFMLILLRFLAIGAESFPPLKKVLTREEAVAALKERGLNPELINFLRRLPFPEDEETASLDDLHAENVDLVDDECKEAAEVGDAGRDAMQKTIHHLVAVGLDNIGAPCLTSAAARVF